MTKELKARVRTLKSTHKITSAMRIVAATSFNRLKQQTSQMFDFLDSFINISTRIQRNEHEKNAQRLLIVVGGDRGLCGGYNASIRKKTAQYLKDFPDAKVAFIGVKVALKDCDILFSETVRHLRQWTVLTDKLNPIWAQFAIIDIIYTSFNSLYDQKIVLMPVVEAFSKNEESVSGALLDETSIDIFPLVYTAFVMKAIIQAQLCEFSSRMLSMENATQNAEKMIDNLYLTINKMRQAMITKELSETVSGSL